MGCYVYEEEVESGLAQQNCEKMTFPSVPLAVIINMIFVMKTNHGFHLLIVSPLEECHSCWKIR